MKQKLYNKSYFVSCGFFKSCTNEIDNFVRLRVFEPIFLNSMLRFLKTKVRFFSDVLGFSKSLMVDNFLKIEFVKKKLILIV